MTTASLELCKTLFGLSGWKNRLPFYEGKIAGSTSVRLIAPKYDLGYILRKLQPFDHEVKGKMGDMMPVRCRVFIWQESDHEYRAGYQYRLDGHKYDDLFIYAATPEDAACKLAIELFKQGVLKP